VDSKRLQDLPVGIQIFETLRAGNYLYVDKTQDVYELARPASPAYFLSRPRRFGKSMLCSTFDALFQAKKELFKDTWIANSDWQWKKYPVIYLSMDAINHKIPQLFETKLQEALSTIAQRYSVSIALDTPGAMLQALIIQLEKIHGKVVMIVDEYDKPLINNLNNSILLNEFRNIMKEFYGCVKGNGSKLRFLFITGVSKFSMVSIFSEMNHLEPLSLSPNVATACGYTQAELEHNFADHLAETAKILQCTKPQLLAEIKDWYNGYCFSTPALAPDTVYNPFSVVNFLKSKQFLNYWFESGTPSFAIEYFKNHQFSMADFEQAQSSSLSLSTIDPDDLDLRTVLYQTGYLTIKGIDQDTRDFILGFPNREVRHSCLEKLLTFVTGKRSEYMRKFAVELSKLFINNQVTTATLTTALAKICAQIPSTVAPKLERGYQFMFWIILELMDLEVFVEDPTAKGRIDVTIIINNRAYVIELKIRGTIDDALEQIENTRYAEKYLTQGKEVVKIGIVFDAKERKVSACTVLDPVHAN
jgi:hypothetical protein